MTEQKKICAPQRIYVKDISFESPHSPDIFLEEWRPEINVEMDNTVVTVNENGVYDVQLKVTVTAKLGDRIAYIAEVVQGGVFMITGFDEEDIQRLVGTICPETLYPYARLAISDVITQGSYPSFMLTPVNFNYIYAQQEKKVQESTGD